MDMIFTPRALETCLGRADDLWFDSPFVPEDGSWDVLGINRPEGYFVFHREDDTRSPRIVLIDQGQGIFYALPPGEARRVAAERVHRTSLECSRPPVRLPRDWSAYHDDNLVTFFAVPIQHGEYRWILEHSHHTGTLVVCFWEIYTGKDLRVQGYTPESSRLAIVLEAWESAYHCAAAKFSAIPPPSATESIQNAIDLEAVAHGAVTRYRTFEEWLGVLTERQREFVEHETTRSVKLRGPAGSGKTLAMELKVLREVYRARAAEKSIRILFATHSWAMAEQVDSSIRLLDSSGDVSNVHVLPLTFIADEYIPKEGSSPTYRLLGEDSLSGRRLQLERVSETLQTLRRGDWLAYRDRVSQDFRERVEEEVGSPEYASFLWDLLNEFASVLSANGILPGINAERRYLALPRTSWMMPLEGPTEKKFVLHIYTRYISALMEEGLLTTDQVVHDCLNYLETFVWELRRAEEGYDFIFVDELHLFGEQERLLLHYLTRSADQYPVLFMALDPRQAPSEVYADFQTDRVRSGSSGLADLDLGNDVDSVELSEVHRFSENLLRLVRHINSSYPALGLGTDWEWDLEAIEAPVKGGQTPTLTQHSNREEEIGEVIKDALRLAAQLESGERAAIVLLDPLQIDDFSRHAEEVGVPLVTIRGRSDLDQIRYTRRSIVLSAAEYVGGLQFAGVVCGGFTELGSGRANASYQLRRFLSLLYLAISRATTLVHIHVNDKSGGVPPVLETALAKGVLARRD